MKTNKLLLYSFALSLILSGCVAPTATSPPTLTHTATASATATTPSTPTATATATASATPTFTLSPSPTLTFTATPTLTPTPVSALRMTVTTRAQCRYGPGWAYLYKYGLVVGSNMEVIGRNAKATWLLVQAINGNNPCWVRADLIAVKGDPMTLAEAGYKLPYSRRYYPPGNVYTMRRGNEVTIYWDPVRIDPGNDSGQYPYLIEAWVCHAGELVFEPAGTWETSWVYVDEPGCSEPSHAQIFTVEKHGYSWPRKITFK